MKNYIFYAERYIICIIISFSLLNINSTSNAQESPSTFGDFPFESSLYGTTQPSFITVSSGAVSFTNQGIQLTDNIQNQFGGVYINDRRFKSINGIIVEFEYMMHGGGTSGGDGMSMFLFDASVNTPAIGAAGAAIGYGYNSGSSGKKKGLTGAYLGVAFDSFGNHNQVRWEGISNQSGIPFLGNPNGIDKIAGAVDANYNVKDEVVLRGAKNGELTASRPSTGTSRLEEGYSGYPVLISQSPYYAKGIIMEDNDSAYYTPITPSYSGRQFSISGNGTFTKPTDDNYRKAIVELFPAEDNDGGGFYVTVSIQHNKGTDVIIDEYHYKQKFYYRENIMLFSPYSKALDTWQPVFEMDATVPEFLRIGFAASTGVATNYNVVKNVHIRLPRAAEAYNDSIEIHPTQTASISPYGNDIAYDGLIRKIQSGHKQNINPREFRFVDNNVVIALNAGDTFIEHTNSQGVWRYDVSTKQVTFKPADGFKGEAKIEYDIKGKEDLSPNAGPYHDEAYRSMRADIVINVTEKALPSRRVLTSNKMVTGKPRK